MIKVLVFTGLYASAEHPTRAAFNVNICQALSRSCDVQVVSPQPWWHRTRTPRDWFRAPRDTSAGSRRPLRSFAARSQVLQSPSPPLPP